MGYQPQFGFPLMDFTDVKTAFNAIVFEDETGYQEPFMAELNSGEFQKLANMLIQSNFAERKGNTLVLRANDRKQNIFKKKWLYFFLKSSKDRDIKELIKN